MSGAPSGAAATMTPEEAVKVLCDDERPEAERIAAARLLGEQGTIAAISPMLHVLERAEAELGLELAKALRAREAWALLARELKNGTEPRRERAAMGLVRVADPRAAGALGDALGDASVRVRKQVVQALARLSGEATEPALLRALADAAPEVRWLAADALRRRALRSARPALEAALAKEEDDLTRSALERALAAC